MRRLILTMVLAATVTGAEADEHEPATAATSSPAGLAFGVEVGEPSSVTMHHALGGGRLGLTAAAGTGTRSGLGLALRAGVTLRVIELARTGSYALPLHLGLGVRHYRHGYRAMSVDELPDAHTGIRIPAGVTLVRRRSPLELYIEAAPGYDIVRSASCSFASGAFTLCPHAQAPALFVDAVIGARWRLR